MGQSVIKPLFLRDKLNANYSSKVLSSPLAASTNEHKVSNKVLALALYLNRGDLFPACNH